MKFLFLMTQDLESPLGVGRIGPFARGLSQLGHNITIIALHPNYKALQKTEFFSDGVRIQYVAPMHVSKKGDQKFYYSTCDLLKIVGNATLRLIRAALGIKADIILICKPHPMNSIAGLLAGIIRHSVVVVDCDDYEAESGNFQSGWQRSIVSIFEKKIPTLTNGVITNTTLMSENLRSWGVSRNKLYYLPNGVERNRFGKLSSEDLSELAIQLQIEGYQIITYIGSLSLKSHPINLLIEAFVKIHSILPNTRLLIVGGGEDQLKLIKIVERLEIQNYVIFTGRIPPEKIPAYYGISNVTVDPIYEDLTAKARLPIKMFESWVCGIPFITADVGDRRLLFGEPPAGLLVTPGNAESLADAIIHLFSNPELIDILIQRGLERVKDYYWDHLASKFEKYFQQFLIRDLE